ncbi:MULTISPECIES: hypothetical protein [Streptomyces]|uniref:Uncharacterized protein n=1 Tax=Streptomyces desertarenae TaxID=2666184 RepID=A0ABW4PHD1_9ACTN
MPTVTGAAAPPGRGCAGGRGRAPAGRAGAQLRAPADRMTRAGVMSAM